MRAEGVPPPGGDLGLEVLAPGEGRVVAALVVEERQEIVDRGVRGGLAEGADLPVVLAVRLRDRGAGPLRVEDVVEPLLGRGEVALGDQAFGDVHRNVVEELPIVDAVRAAEGEVDVGDRIGLDHREVRVRDVERLERARVGLILQVLDLAGPVRVEEALDAVTTDLLEEEAGVGVVVDRHPVLGPERPEPPLHLRRGVLSAREDHLELRVVLGGEDRRIARGEEADVGIQGLAAEIGGVLRALSEVAGGDPEG